MISSSVFFPLFSRVEIEEHSSSNGGTSMTSSGYLKDYLVYLGAIVFFCINNDSYKREGLFCAVLCLENGMFCHYSLYFKALLWSIGNGITFVCFNTLIRESLFISIYKLIRENVI